MIQKRICTSLIACVAVFLTASVGRSAEVATADDTAHFLAGLPVTADSPLAELTHSQGWLQHSREFNSSFDNIEKQQLSKIRGWSRANLTAPKPVLFYMFSGPDFLYADAFFPSAATYVLTGLEPVGRMPDMLKLTSASVTKSLNGLRRSLRSVLSSSFFITSHMGHDLGTSSLGGTLPVLYVFLARTGHTIQEAKLVNLDEHGEVTASEMSDAKTTHGVKITFSDRDGRAHVLYYFKTDLADPRFRDSAFLHFCEKLNEGDAFIKSASYLLHSGHFSRVRKFLLDHSATILQDDTGIPVGLYDMSKWQVQPFGKYAAPIPIFSRMYQPKMRALFASGHPSPIDFRIGYRWRRNQSGLLVAKKKDVAAER